MISTAVPQRIVPVLATGGSTSSLRSAVSTPQHRCIYLQSQCIQLLSPCNALGYEHKYSYNHSSSSIICSRRRIACSIVQQIQGNVAIQSSMRYLSSSAATKPKVLLQHISKSAKQPSNALRIEKSDSKHLQHNNNINQVHNMIDRKIRIKRRKSNINNDQNTHQNNKQPEKYNMNGYKYRLLTTPQLTNDMINIPKEETLNEAEGSTLHTTAATSTTPTPSVVSSHIIAKENHDIRQLKEQYTNDAIKEDDHKKHFPKGVRDTVLSSKWWQSLFGSTQSAVSQSASNTLMSKHPNSFQSSSMRNRRSSILLEEIINNKAYTGVSISDEQQQQSIEDQDNEGISERIRVRSVQAASSIDVVAVLSKVFGGGSASQYTKEHPLSDFFATSPPLRHVFGRTNIIIQLSPPPMNCSTSLSQSQPRYVAIYRFGSVVFFNLTTKESSRLLEQIKKHSVDPIATGFERREHFEVALQPQLETATGKIAPDRAMVRELDMNTVGIVSNIMGQTVALDWHNDTVDELLAKFSSVNSSVERTGSFTSIERHTLFQVVARNNSLFIDMVGKLGIKDRSDTAWHLSQYEQLHEDMRKEFDLDERFRNVEFKLDLIQQNAKFFLEVLHAQKSNTLEWVIIVLISFECALMILEMSGWGPKLLTGSW